MSVVVVGAIVMVVDAIVDVVVEDVETVTEVEVVATAIVVVGTVETGFSNADLSLGTGVDMHPHMRITNTINGKRILFIT